jgi:uncharacterized protein (DUF2235 family)
MGRKIVVFADGTGNTVGGVDSNVLRLCKMLDSSEDANQLAIYDPGVGTMASLEDLHATLPSSVSVIDDEARRPRLLRFSEQPLGYLFGYGTQRNIRRLYRKLICVYEPGDEIFLFGFSRGAFTVRALAGVIYRCGLPRSECIDQADNAICLSKKHFEACRNSEELRFLKQDVRDFQRKYARPCNIRFLGVWDTVKSVGYLFPRNLPHTRHNPIIETVRHALSLSEHRSFYAPTTWGGLDADTRLAIYVALSNVWDEPGTVSWQNVQEVWFPGDHSDVGGGHRETALADVSLHWMINEAYEAGLRVDTFVYSKIVPKMEKLSPCDLHDVTTGNLFSRVVWPLIDRCPRRDIDNEPPPPRLSMLRPKRLGPRMLGPTARRGFVTIHRTAERLYCEHSAPWKGTLCRFTDTKENIKKVRIDDGVIGQVRGDESPL